jgi:hypothetical protein
MHTVVAVARDSAGNRATSSSISILVNNGRNGATPPQQDTTAPQISNVVSSGIGNTSATISFTTNESATTRVYYSTVSPVVITTAPFQEQSGFRTSHTVTLPQLAAGTTYHVLIVATDAVGNMTSMPSSFTTLSPSGDMSAPLISSVVSTAVVSTTANVSWMTNEAATTRVYYSTVSPVATATAPFQELSGSRTSHSVSLSPLAAGTIYYLLIVAVDAAGNMSSMPTALTTPTLADTAAPLISNVVSSGVGSTTANISWMTNEATIGRVYYGTTNPLLLSGSAVAAVTVFATNQNVHLHSLSPNTTYHYVVVASDTANNNATSTHYSFMTTNE